MAGAGYKLFNTGDVLTAAQVNTYLNEQTVMVFASSAARTSALSGVLAEGMVSYLQDTNAVEVYNGSAWVGVSGAGDVTEVQAGTGISVASGTGPIPVVTNTMATAIDAEGDLIIGDAADAFQRLAIGSNGNVLTVDTAVDGKIKWAAPAGGGGYTELATGTLSGTTVTLSSISASYENLVLAISGAVWGTGVNDISIRFNNVTASTYKEYVLGARGTSASAQTAETWNASGENAGRVQLGSAWNNTAGNNHHILTFNNYATANYPVIRWEGVYQNAANFMSLGFGIWTLDTTSVINRIDISTSSGYTFSAGTYTLYGVK